MARAEDQEGSSGARRLIEEDVRNSKVAVVKYGDAVREAALRNIDPQEDRNVELAHARMHTAVMNAFQSLRAYIKQDLTEYWGVRKNGDKVDEAIVLDPQGEQLDGLHELEQYHDSFSVTVDETWHPDKGHVRTKQTEANLLPPRVCIDAHNALKECQVALGLGASTKNKIPNDEPDLTDLRGLLQTRGQSEAAEKLPKGASEGDD